MFTNADITLYSYVNGGYTRSVIHEVFWQEVKQSNVLKSGLTSADSVKIFIPLESILGGLSLTTSKDLVIEGIVTTEIDNTTQQSISASLTALKATHSMYTVSVADNKLYGSLNMQHYQISCK